MDIVNILIGALVGAVITYFVLERIRSAKAEATEHSVSRQMDQLQSDLNTERQTNMSQAKDLSALQISLEYKDKQLQEQQENLAKLNKEMAEKFENIAGRLMKQNADEIQKRHTDKLNDLLNPFKEKIQNFEKKVEQSNKDQLEKNATLSQQIKDLKTMNENLGKEAHNLATALKGDKKLQGDWGEKQLETILQYAGLKKDMHYQKQSALRDEEGALFRPDYIINLPDDKHLVVDSKVSIVEYEAYFNTDDNEKDTKALKLKNHLQNLRNHIKDLSSKDYTSLHGINPPDYVLMFVPIEAALNLALTEDPSLFEFALKKQIVLVSNSTLLATLKTISYIWRQDNQNKYAMEIADEGGKLYDKFVGFVENLISVGKQMDSAKENYEKAMGQLHTGRGNLVNRAEKLKKLGAKASKTLPNKLVDRSDD